MNRSVIGTNLVRVAMVVAVFILAAYAFVYWNAPFEGTGNDIFLAALATLAPLFAAVTAARVYFSYHPGDAPRGIWVHFSGGVWMWFVSEVIWYYYYLTIGEITSPSLADIGWILGFVAFTIAFYKQYKPIYRGKTTQMRWIAVGSWVAVLLVALVISRIFGKFTLSTFFDYFYAAADLAVGIFAAHTVWKFRGGALGRPWLGLFIFSISDIAYAIAVQTGAYAWSVESGNALTLAIDVTYVAAYLFLAIGFLAQYALIRYASYTVDTQPDS